MKAYFCESGIGHQDVEAALQALSLSKSETVPILAVKLGEGAGRVILANEPMLALFRAGDLDQMTARLFESSDPGARRLAELSRNLPSEAGPRLERLRFFFGPVVETVTFLCRKCAIAGEAPVLVAAALGARPQRPPAIAPEESSDSQNEVVAAPKPGSDTAQLEEIKSRLSSRLGDSKTVRFLWRTDAADKITEITPPLAEVVGAAAADLLGRDFGDIAKHLEKEPDGPLGRAFAKRETFSGIDVLWPNSGAAAAVPVSLGGLPAFRTDRSFDGYRGFGVIRVDGLAAAEPHDFPASGEPQPQEPAPVIADNVVPLRPLTEKQARRSEPLSDEEETAFREIAAALTDETAKSEPAASAVEEPPAAAMQTSIADSLGRNAAMIFDRLGIGIQI